MTKWRGRRDRLPIFVTLGGGLLGWIAGGLTIRDPIVQPYVPRDAYVGYIASALGAVLVVALARWLERRRPSASS